ncbi:MAG: hypothetical protein KC643_12850 [Nitrospira sp.]|nr:hypothetical protein [Nitrospira sp.]MCA9498859.1 hypothetical protein [Nitrospira sp.]
MLKTPGFLKQNFTTPILAGLMVLAPIGGKLGNIFGGTAHGQDSAHAATLPPDFNKVPTSIPQENSNWRNEAWMKAGEYAKSNPAVGIAVYGRSSDATGQQVGEFIQAVLAKQGINSQLFLADSERLGVGVSFYIKDMSYGPTGLDKAGQNIRTVIEHFPQAWPDYQASAPNYRQPG